MSAQNLLINIGNDNILLSLLRQEIEHKTNELKQKTTELEQKTAEYNQLVAENNRQKATIESNEKLIAELQAENEQLKVDIATLTAKVAQLEADNKELKEKYETLKVEHKTLKQEHETLKVEHNDLKDKFYKHTRYMFYTKLRTAIQDLNAYEHLETKLDNSVIDQLKELHEERNSSSHYIRDSFNKNKINYRLNILKDKMEKEMTQDDINFINGGGDGNLYQAVLTYLSNMNLGNPKITQNDINLVNMWWN